MVDCLYIVEGDRSNPSVFIHRLFLKPENVSAGFLTSMGVIVGFYCNLLYAYSTPPYIFSLQNHGDSQFGESP